MALKGTRAHSQIPFSLGLSRISPSSEFLWLLSHCVQSTVRRRCDVRVPSCSIHPICVRLPFRPTYGSFRWLVRERSNEWSEKPSLYSVKVIQSYAHYFLGLFYSSIISPILLANQSWTRSYLPLRLSVSRAAHGPVTF